MKLKNKEVNAFAMYFNSNFYLIVTESISNNIKYSIV